MTQITRLIAAVPLAKDELDELFLGKRNLNNCPALTEIAELMREPLREVDTRRPICTRIRPWRKEDGFPCIHPDATEVGEQEDGHPGGDIVRMQCPHCNVSWKMELPQ